MLLYRILADIVVVCHLAWVLFIVLGLAAILLGAVKKWQWVRNFWFRLIHLLMIATVVEESVLGITCPLTDWEDMLREKAGVTAQQGTFIGRIIDEILFWHVSDQMLLVIYCLFGLAVLLTMFLVPPHWPRKKDRDQLGR